MPDAATAARPPLSPNNFARLILVLAGVIWLGVGISGFLDPEGLAAWADIDLESMTAVAEFRAMYGGLSVALAGLHLGAAVRGAWLRLALMMSSAITGGLLVGRVATIALDGMFGPVALGLAGIEVVLLALSGTALWRLWKTPASAPAAATAAAPVAAPVPAEEPAAEP